MRILLTAIFLLLTLTGCEKSHEKVMRQTTAKLQEAVGLLQGVKDEASAKAAAPKVQAVADELKKLQQEANHLGEADKEVKKELGKSYGTDFITASRQLAEEIRRIRATPAASGPLEQAITQLNWEKLER